MERIGNDKVFRVRKEEREMGVEILKIGVQIRKFVIFSIRTCYRTVCNHPFLVGLLFFFVFLYRSFPFLFSLLVSASPVLVCTAILLGTLLSFGQPNIPEIEKEEKTTHEILSLKTGIQGDAIVVERDESSFVERHTVKSRDIVEKSIEEESATEDVISKAVESNGSLVRCSPLNVENSKEIQLEKQLIEEEERDLRGSGFEMKHDMNGLVLENHYSRIEEVEDENVELQHDKLPVESVGSRLAVHADSTPSSPWKPVEAAKDELGDEASDSGSDGDESSSPDASMADIIPMLDELHPLLDEDAPQPAHMSHDGSDAGSEQSQKSSNGIDESEEDSENHEEEVGDDDEEEEETQGGKDNTTKTAITWTEDDQKNLMDLGTSELERNQRLENLIARRRARRMMTEKNLIDLEGADLHFNVAPISTVRRNPFDLPYDSNENPGLPPIPGSAPSILMPRHNPFDLPYDSSEEKPDLLGDSFDQEFMPVPPKEAFFRRHESFNVGPSIFGPPRQKQDIKLRPYFEPERMASEGTNYSHFERQSSELSDSKVSYVPDTESICSTEDQDDKKVVEEDFSQETELILGVEHPSEHVGHGSESSEDEDAVELGQAEERGIEDENVEIKLGNVESHLDTGLSLSVTRDVATPGEYVEHDTGGIHLNRLADEVNQRARSSSSSLLEVHERIFDEKENVVPSSLEPTRENVIEESGISVQHSLQESDFNFSLDLVGESQRMEPVYDASPPAVQKNLSSSSISSDQLVETSELGFSPVLIKRTLSFADRESEESNQCIEIDTSHNEPILSESLVHPVDSSEPRSEVSEKSEHIILNNGLSGDDQKLDSANASVVPEFVAEHESVNLKPSSSPESADDCLMYQDGSSQREQDQVPSSSFYSDIGVAVHQTGGKHMASATCSFENKSSEDLTSTKVEQPSVVFGQVSCVHPIASSSESDSVEKHPLDKEAALLLQRDQVQSSNSDANFLVGFDQVANEAHTECLSEEKPMYEFKEQLPMSDKAMVELSSESHKALKEPSVLQVLSSVELSNTNSLDASEVQAQNEVSSNIDSASTPGYTYFRSEISEARSPASLADLKDNALDIFETSDHITVQPFNFPTEALGLADSKDNILDSVETSDHITVQPFNFPTEASASQVHEQVNIEEADEIKEIDEGLLMELDTVGDFSVKEMNPQMPLVEARSVEDIDSIFKKTEAVPSKTEVEIGEFEIPNQNLTEEEINSGMPVLEATSPPEDIDTGISQSSEVEIEKPVVVESLHAELIPEGNETRCSEYGISCEDSYLTDTKMELPIVEARSIEDIDLAFTQLHGVERHGSSSSIDDRLDVESKAPEETYSDLHTERQKKLSSVEDRPEVVEPKGPSETNSDLHVSEARSLEDADETLKLVSESNADELLKSDFKDGSSESESNKVDPSKEIESSIKKPPGVQETSTKTAEQLGPYEEIKLSIKVPGVLETRTGTAEQPGPSKETESSIKEPSVPETRPGIAEQPDHGAQTSDDLSSSMSDKKGEKAKSDKSRSSSSSSSSSSDSE